MGVTTIDAVRERLRETEPFFYLAMFGLLSCLLLGGGTKSGFLTDAILQLISIPILLVALWRILDSPSSPEMRRVLTFCGAIVAVPLIQLVPLPPLLWTHLPGRETLVETFELLHRRPPWAPLSMAPQLTWLSTLSFLPPLAVFLSVLTLSWRERRLLSLMVVAFAVTSAFFGLVQLAQGPDSPLRFYEITNPNSPVGFFANANHFAALLYSGLVLTAAWLTTAMASASFSGVQARDGISIPWLVVLAAAIIVLVAAGIMARSRAGLILTFVGLFGVLLLTRDPLRKSSKAIFVLIIMGVIAVALLFVGNAGLLGVLDRFDANSLADERKVFAHVTIEAAKGSMPMGAGLGSFVSVYPLFERARDLVEGTYANHAHNDLLELWLETGILGIGLVCVMLYFLAQKSIRSWGTSSPTPFLMDRSLRRAAILIIALLLGHSLVDYPLRTSAMMAIMSFACALLVDPAGHAPSRQKTSQRNFVSMQHRPRSAQIG